MKSQDKLFVTFIVLLFLVLASPLWAEDAPGVTETTIKVGTICDLTGPLAFYGQELSAGARLYFSFINDQGGVHGRKIEYVVEDDGYRPPKAVAAARKLLDKDKIFCFLAVLGTPSCTAIFPILEQEQVPLVGPVTASSSMHTPPKKYVFALPGSYDAQSRIAVKYILESGTESPRLAILYQDDGYGKDGLKGLKEGAKAHNLEIVAEETYKRGAVDFSSQALNLKKANPTHVILYTVIRETAAILTEAKRLNWNPVFIGSNATADDKIIALAGDAAEGYMALQFMDFYTEDLPAAAAYRELIKKYDPEHSPGFLHALGYTVAGLLVEGLNRAGENPTREGLVEAMESFKNFAGTMMPAITYGENLRGGGDAAIVLKADVNSKKFVKISDWIKPKPLE